MRQAGRSLPEYRELRKQLQPLRGLPTAGAVRGGDAPAGAAARRRCGRDVRRHHAAGARRWASTSSSVESVGPVIAEPVRTAADVERLRVARSRRVGPVHPRGGPARARASWTPERALVGFCGGAVHGRRLPDRGQADARLRDGEDDDVPRARGLARADGEADRDVRRVRAAKVEAGADVIQLFDSWVGALSPADYGEFVAPHSARILAAVDVPTIHFGTGTATLLGVDGGRRRRRHRARLADPAGRGLGARRRGARRAGQPRPGPSCSARGSAPRPARSTCSRAPAAARATSSTSATACSRTRILPSCGGWSSSSTSEPRRRWPCEDDRDGAAPAPAARRRRAWRNSSHSQPIAQAMRYWSPLGTFSREQAEERFETGARAYAVARVRPALDRVEGRPARGSVSPR